MYWVLGVFSGVYAVLGCVLGDFDVFVMLWFLSCVIAGFWGFWGILVLWVLSCIIAFFNGESGWFGETGFNLCY